ncbi:protein of unknown function DUF881 [Alkaliphilus metalliredigens QYMF]|uniref:Division initiation protein n=1 Tax=Alkaliphilus metalliredigens (strain QYMF) TaxID=293826 RepID=A6TS58_ALKMQ|nr:DUF881 domain-containing protein [Alkaliphilus metalliredigens]ABR49026.1 protein of unknown function DUF881 [Alkaliphilus metalliredigens QYMF]
MKAFKGKLAVGILCAILGLTISMQLKTVRDREGEGFLSTHKAQELAMQLSELRGERTRLNEELTELEKRLREYEISEADENLIIRNLRNDLDRFQIMSGSKALQGPGVSITIADPPADAEYAGTGEVSLIMYNYEILLSLINVLNAAGAEAISINNQRYIATTEVYLTSNSVMINDVPTSPPFMITAIGSPEDLESSLNMRYGIIWEIRQHYERLNIEVRKESELTIPRYSRVIDYQFAKPIENL